MCFYLYCNNPCHSLLRLRQEVSKLITTHIDKITDAVKKAMTQSLLYEALLQGLSVSRVVMIFFASVSKTLLTLSQKGSSPSHPKAQSEIAYWREREEEARRRIVSTNRQR